MRQQINKLQYSKCKKVKKIIVYKPVYSNQETSELNGIILEKLPVCQKKNHKANHSINLLVHHEKNYVENWHCATKTKKEKKQVNVPSKNSILHEQNPVKNYHCGMKRKRKKIFYLSAKQWINSVMLWTKFFEKLPLCNEGKERTKKKDFLFFLFLPFFAIKAPQGLLLLQPVKKGLFRQDQNFTEHLKGVPKDNQSTHTPI